MFRLLCNIMLCQMDPFLSVDCEDKVPLKLYLSRINFFDLKGGSTDLPPVGFLVQN